MGGNSRIATEIAQIAAGQHGNVTRTQLVALGISDQALAREVRAGRLYRVYRSVYSVGRPPTTAQEFASAAVLACGPRAALSHDSAMALWGLWKRWTFPLHVTVANDRRPKGITVHRVAGLLRRDVTTEADVRVTSPARTLLDCAPQMAAKALTRRVNDARRGDLLTLGDLEDVVRRFPLHPGAPLLAPLARTTQNPTRSPFEDDFLPFCLRFGLPTPRLNTVIAGHEVDAFFEAERVIVELDGWDFHSDRESFEDDRERDATMLALQIPTVRITKRRLRGQPEREAARLHTILESRRRRPA